MMNTIMMTNVVLRGLVTLLLATAMLGTASAQETVEYIHTDALGSPVAISDASGHTIKRTVYEPYGAVMGGEVDGEPGYTGHVSDSATGLIYMQQRYYDPSVGRFLSSDPVLAVGGGSELFNRYRYAMNNPYRYLDPDGRVDWGMVGDSFKIEAGFSLGISAKFKLGPVKLSIGLGEATWGGGGTLAADGYAFQEVAGPSFAVEAGSYGFGFKGEAERSYQGRHDLLYSEEVSKGGFIFGRKSAEMSVDGDGSNAELSGNASIFPAKLAVSADLGKALEGLQSPSKSALTGAQGFKGTFRVEGRLDAKALTRTLKGGK
jgi:RHS repeat-associated protein